MSTHKTELQFLHDKIQQLESTIFNYEQKVFILEQTNRELQCALDTTVAELNQVYNIE